MNLKLDHDIYLMKLNTTVLSIEVHTLWILFCNHLMLHIWKLPQFDSCMVSCWQTVQKIYLSLSSVLFLEKLFERHCEFFCYFDSAMTKVAYDISSLACMLTFRQNSIRHIAPSTFPCLIKSSQQHNYLAVLTALKAARSLIWPPRKTSHSACEFSLAANPCSHDIFCRWKMHHRIWKQHHTGWGPLFISKVLYSESQMFRMFNNPKDPLQSPMG